MVGGNHRRRGGSDRAIPSEAPNDYSAFRCRLFPKLPVPGVYAGREALMARDSFANLREGRAFMFVQCGAQVPLVFARDPRDFAHRLLAAGGEAQSIHAAVVGAAD